MSTLNLVLLALFGVVMVTIGLSAFSTTVAAGFLTVAGAATLALALFGDL